MTNDETQMTKEFQMTNARTLKVSNMLTGHSGFGFGHSFDIRHSVVSVAILDFDLTDTDHCNP